MHKNNGMIFNIQKYSLHDGPGIRTVVFLKGCPLHCPWCSNPESQSIKVQITWNKEKCTHCNTCVTSCPENAIQSLNNSIVIDETLCTGCLLCTQVCPTNALSFEGELRSVDEIMVEVIKDIPFYEESGGGMTLSGGEVLQQASFATQLLKEAKKHHIHTAAETTCYCDKDAFSHFIKHLDLLLCDIKHYDSNKHQDVIGAPLEQILENIRYAVEQGLEVVARIPVIPDFNYSLDDAEKFCQLLTSLGITKVSLLPFHNYGENKYALLNMPYTMSEYNSIDKNDNQFIQYIQVFKDRGLIIYP